MISHVVNIKNKTNEWTYKTGADSQIRKQISSYKRGEGMGVGHKTDKQQIYV